MNRDFQPRRLAAGVLCAVAILFGALGASSYQGCNVYDPSLLLPANDARPAPDAPRPADTCAHAQPPPRPAVAKQDAAQQEVSIVAAFNTIDLGVAADGGITVYGYDLDGVCTCPGPPSCAPQTSPPQNCDYAAGRDNTAVYLFLALGAATSTGIFRIDEGLQTGQYGLLIAINGYNLELNDDKVVVDFYLSNGLNRDADGGIPTPQLNGSDLWTIDPGSLVGSPEDVLKITSCAGNAQCQPLYSDDQAYVSNGFVVAHMSRPLPIGFGTRSFLGGATMSVADAIIVGKLSPFNLAHGGISYKLTRGTIAGRWPMSELLSTLSNVSDPLVDGGFVRWLGKLRAPQERRVRGSGHLAERHERQQRAARDVRRRLRRNGVHRRARGARRRAGCAAGDRGMRRRRRAVQRYVRRPLNARR